eukprot:gb/GECG01006441.1/.p1 GENE.gb/GECG01006441.1/~~gb/GECG01006441.1/.p1  ORF type:complete len:1781 (+),score=167.34 gb/GECG01006441.1/:1-5343(+)
MGNGSSREKAATASHPPSSVKRTSSRDRHTLPNSQQSTENGKSALLRGDAHLYIRRGALLEWVERTGLGRTALLAMIDHFFRYASPFQTLEDTSSQVPGSKTSDTSNGTQVDANRAKCVNAECVNPLLGVGLPQDSELYRTYRREDVRHALHGHLPEILVKAICVCAALRDSSSLSRNSPLPLLDRLQEEIEPDSNNLPDSTQKRGRKEPTLEQYLLFLSLNISNNQTDHMLVLSSLIFGVASAAFERTELPDQVLVYVAPRYQEQVQLIVKRNQSTRQLHVAMSEAKGLEDLEIHGGLKSVHSDEAVLLPILPLHIVRSRLLHLIRELPGSLGYPTHNQESLLDQFDANFPSQHTSKTDSRSERTRLALGNSPMYWIGSCGPFISRAGFMNWAKDERSCKGIFGLRNHLIRFCQACASLRARAQNDGYEEEQRELGGAATPKATETKLAARLAEQTWKRAYCSYCFQYSYHALVEQGVVNRDIMVCENCGKWNQQCFFCSSRTRFNKVRCAAHHKSSRQEFNINHFGETPRVLKDPHGLCSFCGHDCQHEIINGCRLFADGVDLYSCGYCRRYIHRCLSCLRSFAPVKSRYHLEDCVWCTSEAYTNKRYNGDLVPDLGTATSAVDGRDHPSFRPMCDLSSFFSMASSSSQESSFPGYCLFTGFVTWSEEESDMKSHVEPPTEDLKGHEEYPGISPSPVECFQLYSQIEFQYRQAQYGALLEQTCQGTQGFSLELEGDNDDDDKTFTIHRENIPQFENIWTHFNIDEYSGDSRLHNPYLPAQPWSPHVPVCPLVDGEAYFDFVVDLFRKAQYDIFISGWFFSDFFYLRRNPLRDRLDSLLISKAAEGVHVYILLWSEVGFLRDAIYPGSVFNKRMRKYHRNIHLITHPELQHFVGNTPTDSIKWSHHQKFCVVDQRLAMIGGIDFLIGRWDNWKHRLFDEDSSTWVGLDYKSPYSQAEEDCVNEPYQDVVDRRRYPREPHHDVQFLVTGRAGFDIARSFVLRWNHHRKSHHVKLRLRSLPELSNVEQKLQVKQFRLSWRNNINPSASLGIPRAFLWHPHGIQNLENGQSVILPREQHVFPKGSSRGKTLQENAQSTERILRAPAEVDITKPRLTYHSFSIGFLSKPVLFSENIPEKRRNEGPKAEGVETTFVAGSGHATEFPRDNRQLPTALSLPSEADGNNTPDRNPRQAAAAGSSSIDVIIKKESQPKNRLAGLFRFSVAWARLRARNEAKEKRELVTELTETGSSRESFDSDSVESTTPQKLAYSETAVNSSCVSEDPDYSVPEIAQRVASVLSTSEAGEIRLQGTTMSTSPTLSPRIQEDHFRMRSETSESDDTSDTVYIKVPTGPCASSHTQEIEVPRNAPGASAMTSVESNLSHPPSEEGDDRVHQNRESATDANAPYNRLLSKLPRAASRMLTSWGPWSGSAVKRQEIYGEYLRLIDTAEYYIYVENQYVVSSLCAGISNRVFLAIWQRLRRAIKLQETFRVIVVLPFPEEEGGKWRTIVNYEHRTLWRGKYSLLGRLVEEFPQVDLTDYVCFLMTRTYEFTQNLLQSDQVFIHSKLMIVDDRSAIVSSANINDRSFGGDRDSEMGSVISSEVLIPGRAQPLPGTDIQSRDDICESVMNGKTYYVTRAVQMLRLRLWREFLGFACDSDELTKSYYAAEESSRYVDVRSASVRSKDEVLQDPVASSVYHGILVNTAKTNSRILEHVFSDTPRDEYKIQNDLEKAYKSQPYPMDAHLLAGVSGYFVWAPIAYLEEESMSLRLTDKEYYIASEALS